MLARACGAPYPFDLFGLLLERACRDVDLLAILKSVEEAENGIVLLAGKVAVHL